MTGLLACSPNFLSNISEIIINLLWDQYDRQTAGDNLKTYLNVHKIFIENV